MTDQEIINQYILIGEFIANCFCDNVEVVVHDIRSGPNRSAIAVFNNAVSGRQVGAPLTELGRRFMTEGKYKNLPYLCNYEGLARNGVRVRASTFFIRNELDEVIGYLCVNVDLSGYVSAKRMLEKMISFGRGDDPPPVPSGPVREVFSYSIPDIIGQTVTEHMKRTGKELGEFNVSDNQAVVATLDKRGLFALKGGISEVSSVLRVSEPTIYRYLKKIRKGV